MALAPLETAIVLSWDEYLRLRAEGWEDLPTNFPNTFRPDWTIYHALREWYQNALDETEALEIVRTPEGLEVRDTGRGVNIEDFIMRFKSKPCWARGTFGEGMKIASIVCLRNGFPIMIYAAGEPSGKVIKPVFVRTIVRPGLEVGLLHFLWREFPKERGTTVKIFKYFGDTYEDRVFQNIPKEAIVSEVDVTVCEEKVRKDSMFDYPKGGPYRIYVRDLYVSDWWKPALYSYNFWRVKLDPDRVGVKTDEMSLLYFSFRTMWSEVENREAVKKLFQSTIYVEKPTLMELEAFEFTGGFYVAREKRDIWKRVFDEMYGTRVCYFTTDEYRREADHQGYKVLRVPWQLHRTLESIGVKSDKKVYEEFLMARRVPFDPAKLTVTQQKNLAVAYWLHRKISPMYAYERAPVNPVKFVPYTQLEFGGEYKAGEVRFREDTLTTQEKTFEIFIHEYAHHTNPKAKDNTNEMDEEMRVIMWYIWRLRGERPSAWELYDIFEKEVGLTPKFRPRGRRPPKVKPPYYPKVGEQVKVVSGPFTGMVGKVTEVGFDEATRKYIASIWFPERAMPLWIAVDRLEPAPAKWVKPEPVFKVGDIVKPKPGITRAGEKGEVISVGGKPGRYTYRVRINDTLLVYGEEELTIVTHVAPATLRMPIFEQQGAVIDKLRRNLERLREKFVA